MGWLGGWPSRPPKKRSPRAAASAPRLGKEDKFYPTSTPSPQFFKKQTDKNATQFYKAWKFSSHKKSKPEDTQGPSASEELFSARSGAGSTGSRDDVAAGSEATTR